jgi:hypothetical protein
MQSTKERERNQRCQSYAGHHLDLVAGRGMCERLRALSFVELVVCFSYLQYSHGTLLEFINILVVYGMVNSTSMIRVLINSAGLIFNF